MYIINILNFVFTKKVEIDLYIFYNTFILIITMFSPYNKYYLILFNWKQLLHKRELLSLKKFQIF